MHPPVRRGAHVLAASQHNDNSNPGAHSDCWSANPQVRGAHVLSRYYNSDADAADSEGWFDTGDVCTVDAAGYIQVTPGLV